MNDTAFDVEVSRLTKFYGKVRAVHDFSCKVPRGSFTTLLGPSGCGKTTLLRIIAGFFEPDRGEVFIAGKNQKGIAPEHRETGIVFQDYALFPHMRAAENLAYGLKIRGFKRDRIKEETAKTAALLGLEKLLDRYPGELSGGQQQRLALGRALVLKPRLLLMDEPLSSLDAKLRLRVREELKDIQKRLGITTIYVTHDQEEALALSDHIAVMHDGRLEQFGSPREVYNEPRNAFAADFSGPAVFFERDGKKFFARPEWIRIEGDRPAAPDPGSSGGLVLQGTVAAADFLGRVIRVRVQTGGDFRGPAAVETGAGTALDLRPGAPLRLFVSKFREIAGPDQTG
jgi:ABC-type Fe3+/spermidine/putrescine transport system ATPase subunit